MLSDPEVVEDVLIWSRSRTTRTFTRTSSSCERKSARKVGMSRGKEREPRVVEGVEGESVRLRCRNCGNLTRFDVVERRRTRSYYHFTLGGDVTIEESENLERVVESVTCRWCQKTGSLEDFRIDDQLADDRPEGNRRRVP